MTYRRVRCCSKKFSMRLVHTVDLYGLLLCCMADVIMGHAEVRKIVTFAKHKRMVPLGGEIFHFLRHFLMTSDKD